ncbi:hypothetical protein ADIMK_1343 [Marinobacterium lacunae]|uniref:Uncharacterized protein n=1 Tax=Marinobacterium lacunae TaxID=1232683 RepID=A0A081G0Y4_9GAMM|nr:hypothetical protein [Marinobacterium lacunae]KEA64439.1 hypothetical protein ADIMK_1343 [Marinobacterium lacunae]
MSAGPEVTTTSAQQKPITPGNKKGGLNNIVDVLSPGDLIVRLSPAINARVRAI